jgi:hypothetical protein
MGYMGLKAWGESDLAAGATSSAIKALVKSLRESLKEKGNSYNTEGPVNVALFFEAFIVPLKDEYNECYVDELYKLAEDTAKKLKKIIKQAEKADWDDSGNKADHLQAYKRMLKSVEKIKEKALV